MNEQNVIAKNPKAYHNFFISETFETGIVLEGSEVKSIRNAKISLQESFVTINNNELFLKNAYIKSYEQAGNFAPQEKRNRKLLMHKVEIAKLKRKVEEKTFTLVPTKIYLKNGRVKVEIGLAKGKKLYDKKDDLKEKAINRETQRELKNFNKSRG